MEYILNDYHRNVSDAEFISDVKVVAQKLGKDTLTSKEYAANGKYHSSTLTRRFGSWEKVLELSSLKIKGHNFAYEFSDADVISDVGRVATKVNKETITVQDYADYGRYHPSTLIKRYGSWNKILELAGMKLNLRRNFTDKELLEEIGRVWAKLGRQPTTTDIRDGVSRYSLNSFSRRFGGWRAALQKFLEYINSDDKRESLQCGEWREEEELHNEIVAESNVISGRKHKTPREVNARLRYKVLIRDNCKCCICGASPATEAAVELVVDHIIPWVKGGETVIDNLQTLCVKCNLGKGDL